MPRRAKAKHKREYRNERGLLAIAVRVAWCSGEPHSHQQKNCVGQLRDILLWCCCCCYRAKEPFLPGDRLLCLFSILWIPSFPYLTTALVSDKMLASLRIYILYQKLHRNITHQNGHKQSTGYTLLRLICDTCRVAKRLFFIYIL